MSLVQLDVVLRVGCIAVILLLAALLMLRGQASAPIRLFPPLALCLAGFLAGNTPDVTLRLTGVTAAVANFLSGFAVVFLWWFCLACFDRRFRVRGGVLGVGLVWLLLAAADRGLFGTRIAAFNLSAVLVAVGFGIVAHLVWRLAAERQGDLVQQRHDARVTVAVLLGGLLLVDLTADVLFGFAWRPRAFAMAQNAMIFAFALWLAAKLLSVRGDVLTFETPPPAAVPASEDPLRRRLAALIETERPYLDPDLSFDAFVARLGAPERTVRRLINHDLGFDHFRSFLNHHRLVEARRRLADPASLHEKLITIALDSGFASLPSFNRVFRAAEGCSPGQYREAARAPSFEA